LSNVLYIKANAKPQGVSRTFKISDAFIQAYMQSHPGDTVTTLDLYQEAIHFLTTDDINTVFGPKNEQSKNHPILKYAYQFAGTDKFVIAAPLWNLSIPAVVKAYIDYICVTGITFKYTAQGPVGMCNGKAVHITSRGGIYSSEPSSAYEMGDRYLRTIFAFLGITDFTTIAAEGLDIIGTDVDAIVNKVIADAQTRAGTF
jgi:FMN-dependent NADH-azoreductase